MEAAAYSLAVHPDRSLEKKLDAVVAMMAKAQLPDGYLNSHFIRVEPGKRWTNLRDCHELYCAGHLMEAAVAYFQATGKRRDWQFGDEIELVLPMPVEEIESHPSVRHNCGRVALQRGPLVYCLEETDNGPDLNDIALVKNPRWKVRFDRRLLGGIPVITGQAVRRPRKTWKDRLYQPAQAAYEKMTIKAVPYFLWNNRGEGEMLVWIQKGH